ncbi:lactose regulatory protein lac9 and GAL4-like protein [Aspergillus nanangensis]|uniref:Lactose regulatory protein lac9 and GAL4-like protein n=1 Tax=Aspergillus nanangensis TaxID=2582783 RepID=A0AAD4GR03_ASPNN|nr:lactose regulatory protein lac9 and GAL4-like protein [Aspergillus nanangensis]
MASPPGLAETRETPEPGENRQTADQACRECRRRKSKCDRIVPRCHLCRKFNRRCMYEKLTRTPLTRTHLSKVENELARTKALLRQLMPGRVDDDDNDDDDDDQVLPEYTEGSTERDEADGEPATHRPSGLPSAAPMEPQLDHHSLMNSVGSAGQPEGISGPSFVDVAQLAQPSQRAMRPSSGPPQSVGTEAFSLETPPSSSNFEWDERAGTAGGDRFVDGMASLTSRSNEGGYLGSASGAALLRFTDMRSTDPAGSHGADMTQAGYSRHLSIPFALNSMSQLEPFVDAYFSLYHCSYPIVHEATFRAQFMEIIPRPSGNAWPVLLFVICAVGVFASATQPTDVDLALFEAAKTRLSIDVLESGNLVLVQALTLISNYLQKRNKPNSGYNYMGVARRMAMGIGLHKEFPNWDTSLLTLEMRRRAWYCLYIFDIGAIITFSRPLDFPDDGLDVHLPLNVHDSDITAGTKRPPTPAPETTIYTHLRAQAAFHSATNHIYAKVISLPFPSAAEVMDLDDQCIGKWLHALPPFFQEDAPQSPKFRLCHAIMRWRYRNFRILMYRPFLVGRLMARGEHQEPHDTQTWGADAHVGVAIQRCLNAAQEAVELIAAFWQHEQRTMMACWYGLYFLFQAILIPVICLRNDPQSPHAEGWRGQVLLAVEVLDRMAQMNPTAKRCLDVIQGLCGGYLYPNVNGWGQPTDESPQTQLANLYPLMWPTLEIGQLDGADSIL